MKTKVQLSGWKPGDGDLITVLISQMNTHWDDLNAALLTVGSPYKKQDFVLDLDHTRTGAETFRFYHRRDERIKVYVTRGWEA